MSTSNMKISKPKQRYKKPLSHYMKHGTNSNEETEEAFQQLTGGPLTLGRVLYSTRMCDEISQQEFAGKLGISKQALCDIEKGRRPVSIEKAAHFAEVLGQPESHFVKLALQSLVDDAGLDLTVDVA